MGCRVAVDLGQLGSHDSEINIESTRPFRIPDDHGGLGEFLPGKSRNLRGCWGDPRRRGDSGAC